MSEEPKSPVSNKLSDIQIARLIGQSGCLMVLLVLGALFGGIALDRLAGTRPIFTLSLVLASMPIGMLLLYRFAMGAVSAHLPPPAAKEKRDHDEDNRS